MTTSTSNTVLEECLTQWDGGDVHALIRLLRSKLSPESRRLCEEFVDVESIPPVRTSQRRELCQRIVALLGWYASNTVAYAWRRAGGSDGGKHYLAMLNDVVRRLNKRLPKKERHKLPQAMGIAEAEEKLVELFIGLQFAKKKTEEIVQILQESGVELATANEVAREYGPGLAGAALPLLTKLLGKKTVMIMIQQMTVAIVGRFIGKQAAAQIAKRLAVKVAQKTLTRLIGVVGWALLAVDIFMFVTSPARRITMKTIPFIAMLRAQDRLNLEG